MEVLQRAAVDRPILGHDHKVIVGEVRESWKGPHLGEVQVEDVGAPQRLVLEKVFSSRD